MGPTVLISVLFYLILAPTLWAADISKYHLVFPGSDSQGGCDKYKDSINTAYDEVIAVALAARDTLDTILKGPPPAQSEDWYAHAYWIKAARSINDLWALLVPADKPRMQRDYYQVLKLQKIRRAYNMIVMKSTQEATIKDHKVIYCTGTFASIVEPGQPIGNEGKVGTSKPGQTTWWIPEIQDSRFHVPGHTYEREDDDRTKSNEPYCNRDTLKALTQVTQGFVVLCPKVLVNWPVTAQEQKSKIKVCENRMECTELAKIESLSRTMMHEFLHLYLNYDDVDAMEEVKGPDKKVVVGTDGKPEFTGKRDPESRAYGYRKPYYIARKVPDDALKNVDTYVMFAFANYWKDFQFIGQSGRAASLPQHP